jgi:O-antigen/teichoic acid export membrane protein
VLTVVLLPTGALQLAMSREVSRREALGETDEADSFSRAMVRLGLVVSVPMLVVALALTIPLRYVLDIGSTATVALVLASLVTALAVPITLGALLGYQRFYAVGALYVLPFAIRLAVVAGAAIAGYRLGGAAFATFASAVVTAGTAIWLLRTRLARAAHSARPALAPFLRYLWPVFVGLLGIALLTTVDLLVVRSRFDPTDAGAYAAASAFARIAFFLPATILAVVFPRTAARQARGEETSDILGRSLIVTAAFGLLLALFYGMTGRGLVHTSFGAEFAEGGTYLVLLTVSMTIYSLANVLVGFHLSRDERRYAWIVAAAVPVQVVVLAVVPGSVEDLILANLVVGGLLLAAHELLVDSSVLAVVAGVRHFGAQIAHWRFRDLVKEGLVVVAAATLFVVVLFWPLVNELGSTVVGDGSDASGKIAELWRMKYEGGYHLFGQTHHVLTGAPFGWDEGNGLNIQLLIAYYPAYLLTKVVGPVSAYNLVLLAGYVLSGASMYLLVRYLGCARAIAAWAGLAYIVFPSHLARTPHGSLVHLEFLPLLLLVLVAATEKPSWSRFSLVGLTTLACWLTSGYFGVMAVVAAGAFALANAFASPLRRAAITVAGSVGAAIGATLVVGVLSIISGFGRGAGLDRVASDLDVYGARPLELLLPSPGNFVFGDLTARYFDSRQHGSGPTETQNYIGLVTLVLAVAWLVIAARNRRRLTQRLRLSTVGLTGVVLAAVLLAGPGTVSVLGVDVWMPSRLLWELIPAIRVPSRWVVLVLTALIPLAALGMHALWRNAVEAGRQRVAYTAVAIVACVSFVELAINPSRPRFETSPAPRLYAALADTPDGIVAEYPLLTSNDHVIWQTIYRRPMFGNADFGTRADDARRIVLNPRVPGTAEALAFLGVTAIITHPDALRYVDTAKDTPNASWGPGYELVARVPDGSSVWRVVAVAAPALVTLTGGFGEPLTDERSFVGYPLVSPSGVGTIEFTAKAPSTVRLEFDATAPRPEQTLRLADADREISFDLTPSASIGVPVEVPRGHSYLAVKTDPAATSVADAVVVSKPRAIRAFGTPALVAQTISTDPGF